MLVKENDHMSASRQEEIFVDWGLFLISSARGRCKREQSCKWIFIYSCQKFKEIDRWL